VNDDVTSASDSSWSRNWVGNHHTWMGAYRKYDFPVTTYKIGSKGERQLIETANR
jgi:hypothetical protein